VRVFYSYVVKLRSSDSQVAILHAGRAGDPEYRDRLDDAAHLAPPPRTKPRASIKTPIKLSGLLTCLLLVVSIGFFASFSGTALASPTWGTPTPVGGGHLITSVSCVSTTFCAAVEQVGLNGNVLTYNGVTWSAPTPIDSGNQLNSISCTSSSFCVAVDNVGNAFTTTDGSTWSAPTLIDGAHIGTGSDINPRALTSVSCTTNGGLLCVAVDNNGNAVTYDGTTWSLPTSTPSDGLNSVSCTSITFCAAVGAGDAVTYDGTTWSLSQQYSGTAWITPATFNGGGTSVSCTSATFCVEVGSSGHSYTYSSLGWTANPGNLIDSGHALTSVSCTTNPILFCVAVDDNGSVVTTTDGSTWNTPAAIDGGNYLTSVSCTSATSCATTDSTGNAVIYSGDADIIDSPNTIHTISCPTTSFCAAVDNAGSALTYNGAFWSAPVPVDTFYGFTSVSCTSATFCLAVDSGGNAFYYNGTTWTADPGDSVAGIDSGVQLNSVSCASTFCVAVDNAGNALITTDPTNAAPTWTTTNIDGARALNSVSCTSTFCVAVDYGGKVLSTTDPTNATATWTTTNIDGSNNINSVSCTSTSFCAAVDNAGNALTTTDPTNATPTWTVTSIDGTNIFSTVSCSSSSFCAAVDGSGNVFYYGGTSWAAEPANPVVGTPDNSNALYALSCPTSSFCTASDFSGDAFYYNGSNWSVPSITSISPNPQAQGTTETIDVYGTGFVNGATVSFPSTINGYISVNGPATFVASGHLTASITIGINTPTGNTDMIVTNPNNGVDTGVFTVDAAPTITLVSPTSYPQGATNNDVTITGTNFVAGAQVTFSDGDISVNTVTVDPSGTFLTANITIVPIAPATPGTTSTGDITVTNPDGGAFTDSGGFTESASPTVDHTCVSAGTTCPGHAAAGTSSLSVEVYSLGAGVNYVSGATVSFGAGITVSGAPTVDSSGTFLTANITISSGAATGARDVTVTNPDGGVGTGSSVFTVDASGPPPPPGNANVYGQVNNGGLSISPTEPATVAHDIAAPPNNLNWQAILNTDGNQTATYTQPVGTYDDTGSGAGWYETVASTEYVGVFGAAKTQNGNNGGGPFAFGLSGDSSLSTASANHESSTIGTVTPNPIQDSYWGVATGPLGGGVIPQGGTLSGIGHAFTGDSAPVAAAFLQAPVGSGMGDFATTFPVHIVVPADAYAGTYESIVTYAIVSGPNSGPVTGG